MNVIGFATQFYTLWDYQTETVYFTDSNGKSWPSREKTNYFYIKNISTDLDKVKLLYPDLTIDDGLKGKCRDFSVEAKKDLSPEILKFGKYSGRSIQEVSEIDFGYILYLCENGYAQTRQSCMDLPIVVAHFAKIEAAKQEIISSYVAVESGVGTFTFSNNPQYSDEYGDHGIPAEAYYIEAILDADKNHRLYVIVDDVKHVNSLYPYNMAILGGIAQKTKNKTLTMNLEIISTDKCEYGCYQVGKIIG